jgi:tetrahydromethanopterin S-methyltransferase subunit H
VKKVFLFPDVDETPELVTDKHSHKLLAAYQVLANAGLVSCVVVNSISVKTAKNLYPKVAPLLNLSEDQQTEGLRITPIIQTE